MKHFNYYKPRSLDEAWELKEKIPDALFLAGGTDIMVGIKNGELYPPALISLRSIPELNSIKINGGAYIGALTTISDLIHHPALYDIYSVLVEAAKRLGSVQIRNVATIGGNLCNCSPCADMALPLLVLDAKVRIQTAKKSREIPIDEFFKGPGETNLTPNEILTGIILEPPRKSAKAIFLKKGRVRMDLAIASLAALMEMEGEKCQKARLAAGSVAPVPLRLFKVEAQLEGTTITDKLVAEAQQLAAESVAPITDIRATKEYRRQIVSVLVKRALKNILGWSQA